MDALSVDETLYLLYTLAYSRDEGSVTKGSVASLVERDLKAKSNKSTKQATREEISRISDALLDRKLIDLPKRGRILVTKAGTHSLISSLRATSNPLFYAPKGEKILNTLVHCIKLTAADSAMHSDTEMMNFETFREKFKQMYYEERRKQEMEGIVVIYKSNLLDKFYKANRHSISVELVSEYFDELRTIGEISVSKGEKDELLHWAE